mmetsp:Transcript_80123/g.159890  ORF Transcript_80123/g.159890 Transcript_80123/m.159890 type:complete len:265 (+) Transcript_80123:1278-2072(+)
MSSWVLVRLTSCCRASPRLSSAKLARRSYKASRSAPARADASSSVCDFESSSKLRLCSSKRPLAVSCRACIASSRCSRSDASLSWASAASAEACTALDSWASERSSLSAASAISALKCATSLLARDTMRSRSSRAARSSVSSRTFCRPACQRCGSSCATVESFASAAWSFASLRSLAAMVPSSALRTQLSSLVALVNLSVKLCMSCPCDSYMPFRFKLSASAALARMDCCIPSACVLAMDSDKTATCSRVDTSSLRSLPNSPPP